MKIKRKEIVAFEAKDDYVVETIVENEYRGFWLYKKGYGIKHFMFGIEKEYSNDISRIESLINSNIDGYISIYECEVIGNKYLFTINRKKL